MTVVCDNASNALMDRSITSELARDTTIFYFALSANNRVH